MIVAKFFYTKKGVCTGFYVKGHADAGNYGEDLVCCAVSVAVQFCCNGITQILKKKVIIFSSRGEVCLKKVSSDRVVQSFLRALELQLCIVSKKHKKNLQVIRVEV